MRRLLSVGYVLALVLLAACSTGGTQAPTPTTQPLRVGERAPGFDLEEASSARIQIEEYRGSRPILLFFSMGPGCAGCIDQIVDLEKSSKWKDLDVDLMSIATDPPTAWQQVRDDEQLTSPLLSDPGAGVSGDYGVMRWAMGQEPGHTFVLVDEQGVVRWIKDYGAPENGGLMYVEVPEIVRAVQDNLI